MRLNLPLLSTLSVLALSVPSFASASCASDGQPTANHKCGYFNEELPATWSAVYDGPDILPIKNVRVYTAPNTYEKSVRFLFDKPFYSQAQDIIMYGDMNWSQVDYYFSSGRNIDRTLKALQKYEGWTFSDVTVGGLPAKMYEEPLDNGEVTKGGPGGRYYFIAWDFLHDGKTYRAGLIVHMQAHTTDAFVSQTETLLNASPRLKDALSIPYDALQTR